MPEDYKGAFFDALKIAGVGALTFLFAPWVDATFPDVWPWVRFAVPAFAGVLFLLLLYVFATGKAHLEVVWRIIGEPEVDVEKVIAKFLTANSGDGGDLFEVSVRHKSGRGLGRLALRWAVKSGCDLKVSVPHSDLSVVSEGEQARVNSGEIVIGTSFSITFALKPSIPLPGHTWTHLPFRLNAGVIPRSQTHWTVQYELEPRGRLAGVYAKLIKVDATVVSLVETWR
ncbi:hypothetical protein [Microbacterium sp. SA39]|uniref:hypothetical protein n=1 Tax=Microbacterium sp. SA39 TaxID=1263625 RepID=UPI0005FA2463|nr:hypothetical protein [Microbacterium sp. SA39]KJQ52531.1 hypothetical protein RS85_03421 [Microbacterium sp. SA39]